MRRLVLIACLALAACETPGKGPVVVGTSTRPYDPCPVEATAKLEVEPTNPVSKDIRNAAMVMGTSEANAIAATEFDQVTLPGYARRGWTRLTKIQDWCKARKP